MTRLAGKLSDWVYLEEASQTANSGGGFTRGYTFIKKLPAHIEEQRGREIVSDRSDGTGVSIRATLRYDEDIVKNRFLLLIDEKHPDRRFRITSVRPFNRYEYVEALAEEIEQEPK